jgi:hypothetical protein
MLPVEKLQLFMEKVQKGCIVGKGYKIIAAFLDNIQQTECMAHRNYTIHHDWTDHTRAHRDWLDHKDYK